MILDKCIVFWISVLRFGQVYCILDKCILFWISVCDLG